ncbi:MAG: thymidylate synthase, partial [Chloroflexota bacterium]
NQAFMAVGDAKSISLPDPPCLRGIDTRIRHGSLHFIVYFRSWDLWAGFPSNLAAIQLLKEYMASEIGVEDGEIIAMSKGLHLYDYSWELAKTVVGRNG